MTRNEALKAMEKRTPVIYTGAGSMGRAERWIGVRAGKKRRSARFRGSPQSIGVIGKVMKTKAAVRSYGIAGFIFHIKDLKVANAEELKAMRAYNRATLPSLKFYY